MRKYLNVKFKFWMCLLLILFACEKDEETTRVNVSILPSDIILNKNSNYQFSASVSGTENMGVAWKIREGDSGGTISQSGSYQAPATAGSYHIEVTSSADNSKKAVAIVTVSEISVISIAVTPSTATVSTDGSIQFSASAVNTQNAAVTWSIQEGLAGGSVTAAGLYKAPSSEGTFHVIATSQADKSKMASATVTVTKSEVTINKEKEAAKNLYAELYLGSERTSENWVGNSDNCDEGSIPQSLKDKILKRITYFRKMAGLNNTITMNDVKSSKCQKAALMFKVNGALSHDPPTTWKCYTADGKEAAGKSNIAMGSSGPNAVNTYMRDNGDNNYFVGHRRWLLYPKLKEVGTGDTDNTNAMWVVGDTGPLPTDMPEFIAWPPKGYVPTTVIYQRWSFSISGADFSSTSISMKDGSGNEVAVVMEDLNNGGYGDKTIVWKPSGIILTGTTDQIYKVYINGVKVGTQTKNYQYDVVIFKP